jgi:hypothetical protein
MKYRRNRHGKQEQPSKNDEDDDHDFQPGKPTLDTHGSWIAPGSFDKLGSVEDDAVPSLDV